MPSSSKQNLFAFRIVVALLATCAYASLLHAQQEMQSCPWLNKATAAGFLGQDVNLRVNRPSMRNIELPNGAQPDAVCEFASTRESDGAILRIAVHTMQNIAKDYPAITAQCSNATRQLVGVGNTAEACTLASGSEQVVARVRQRAFILNVSMPGASRQNDPSAKSLMQNKIQNLAEQIAGSLF